MEVGVNVLHLRTARQQLNTTFVRRGHQRIFLLESPSFASNHRSAQFHYIISFRISKDMQHIELKMRLLSYMGQNSQLTRLAGLVVKAAAEDARIAAIRSFIVVYYSGYVM